MELLLTLCEQMGIQSLKDATWTNIELDPERKLNAVLFQSGQGEGCYACYWGYDAADRLACLVTDFGLLR